MLNSGEGGFLCTDSEEYAARAACYAGCYEKLYDQHVVAPPAAVFDAVKLETPNYSLRMNELAAACIRPQIDNLEERVAAYNTRYARVVERLAGCKYMSIPPYNERVRPVADSLQFNLLGFDIKSSKHVPVAQVAVHLGAVWSGEKLEDDGVEIAPKERHDDGDQGFDRANTSQSKGRTATR